MNKNIYDWKNKKWIVDRIEFDEFYGLCSGKNGKETFIMRVKMTAKWRFERRWLGQKWLGGGGEGTNERRETIKFSNKRRIKEIVLKFFVEFFFWDGYKNTAQKEEWWGTDWL